MRGARFGQHFLNAPWVARELVKNAALHPSETVVEVGPGKGALTKQLLAHGAHVVAIEKDPILVSTLQKTFKMEITEGKLKVVEGDIRDITPEKLGLDSYAVAANIPYYITGEIIKHFLTAQKQPRAIALLIQKEVAERIIARDGKESILSLSVKAYGTPSIVARVPRSCFNPPPRVDSAILLIENVSRNFFKDVSEEAFFNVIRAGFASKRKFLANNLKKVMKNPEALLATCDLPQKSRAEDVLLEKWKCLTRQLKVTG
ncbi:MAG: 16S rRNA (adenine(1518)-N(6)/adenine(1519)-N(6))-dimethyltransferase RsmA [Patescibacteria group bacterium]